ncbi:MAG TPA: NUDIX domain-containing protein [Bacteroidales bacterium]|nr:NUDIX domain-containing protein [Bacteroidales bacterium]HQB21344.1 NUDIX domain-containing protein [Bacteroidales bacterium]
MIKIFYKNKIVILTEKEFDNIYSIKINDFKKKKLKKQIISFLESENFDKINIYGKKPEKILKKLKKIFVFVLAAGGLVKNSNDEILYFRRLGYLDLPKGKVEKNETTKQTAIREVSEECGILEKDLILDFQLPNTYHVYPHKRKFALKETQWFAMQFKENYELKPQIEEGIIELDWANFNELKSKFKIASYPSLINLLDEIIAQNKHKA